MKPISGRKKSQQKFIRYSLRIDDESHLSTRFTWKFTLPQLIAICVAGIIFFLMAAAFLVMITPLHRLLPGYMKQSERAASEENLLRLDSLREAYAVNQAFIDNYLRISDPDRKSEPPLPSDSLLPRGMSPDGDSLLSALPRESRFMTEMEKRERYNISVLAPLAADGMMFLPVAPDGIILGSTRYRQEATIVTSGHSPILAVADGRVISCTYDIKREGYNIVIQHPRGFISLYSQLDQPLVDTDDEVFAGQAIAFAPHAKSDGKRQITFRMWHNRIPLIPAEYIDANPNKYGGTGS
ncbi:MAG: M23 family metallopeptidase [Muribaculaceae bacterium]|nr:M23 family metallopeptidase [Muribaculaceae bacterium]